MGTQVDVAVTSATPIDPLFALLIGAFGAASLTVIGGLIGAWIQSIGEHRKWLRERRFEAYRDFIINMSQLSAFLDTEITKANVETMKAKLDVWSDESTRSIEAVSMLGPRSVNAAGQDWFGAAHKWAEDKSQANRDSMSKGRWRFLIAVGKELGSRNVGDTPPDARPL
jgi:hypothetical protein